MVDIINIYKQAFRI